MTHLLNRLIIEASGPQLGLLLAHAQGVSSSLSEADGRHDQRLLDDIQRLLAQAGLQISDLNEVGVGIGPGSFTGIRVALASAQGIAMARNLPLLGLDSLALLALSQPDGDYHVALDARLGEAYHAAYQVKNQTLRCEMAPQLIAVDQLAPLNEQYCCIGDGWALTGRPSQPASLQPSEHWLDLLDQAEACAPELLEPAYLRATVSWKKLSEQPSALSK